MKRGSSIVRRTPRGKAAQKRAAKKNAAASPKKNAQPKNGQTVLVDEERVQKMRAKKRAPSKAECMKIARELCESNGVEFPVRYVHELDREEISDDEDIQKVDGFTIWTMPKHKPRAGALKHKRGRCKIELHEDGRWDCNCGAWERERGVDCIHIKKVKVKFGYSNVPYVNARRRKPTVWLFPKDSDQEFKRRRDAELKMPRRVPQLAFDLCRYVAQNVREDRTGPVGASVPSIAYGMIMKVLNGWDWASVIGQTHETGHYKALGMLEPIGRTTWINRTNDPRVALELYRMLVATARTGRKFEDDLALIDSFDMNTVMVDNARDRKFGPKRASYRPYAERVRYHVGIGSVTNLIAGADFSMHYGLGAGDPAHLPSIIWQIKMVFQEIRSLAGDKAYGPKRNFEVCEQLGVDLYVRKRANIHRRAQDGWCDMAVRMTDMEQNDPEAYDDKYAYRSKVEGGPSSVKRVTPRMRLRRRKVDAAPEYPDVVVDGDLDESLSNLDEDVVGAIMDAAQASVGIARLCEALAILIVHNLRAIVTLEALTDETCDFRYDFVFTAIRTIREADLKDDDAA